MIKKFAKTFLAPPESKEPRLQNRDDDEEVKRPGQKYQAIE